MIDAWGEVSRYLLEELDSLYRKTSRQPIGVDREFADPLDLPTARRLADEIHTVLGVRLDPTRLTAARSMTQLGVLVQAAMNGARRPAAPSASQPQAQPRLSASQPEPPTPDGPDPLSSSQRRIWFMQQLAAGTPLYHVPTRLELTGPLVPEALHAALTDLLTRYDILRTRYPVRSGVPHADVLPPQRARVPLADLSGGSPDAQASELDRMAAEQAGRPFHLAEEPPVRFLLVRRAADSHVLLSTFHHIAVDALTLDLLVRDLGALYGRHVARCSAPAAEAGAEAAPAAEAAEAAVPRRYADFAHHELSIMGSDAMRRAVADRCAALGGSPVPLDLPTDFPRPRFPRFEGDAVSAPLDEPLTAGVRQLARRRRATPFAVLLAALIVTLRRAARRPEILVGTPAAGRTAPEWRQVAGCFVNIVPVLARLAGRLSGEQIVSLVSEAAWQALEAQHVPFDELVRAMSRRSGPPLVTVMFSYQVMGPEVPFSGLADASLTVDRPPGTAKYDLSLYAVDAGGRLRLELEYDTQLYTTATATAVLDAYRSTLAAMVEDPAAAVDLDGVSGFELAGAGAPASDGRPESVLP